MQQDAARSRRAASAVVTARHSPKLTYAMPLPRPATAAIQIEDVRPQRRLRPLPGQALASATRSRCAATIFRDGHEMLGAAVLLPAARRDALAGAADASSSGNDRWRRVLQRRRVRPLGVTASRPGSTAFASLRDELRRKVEARPDGPRRASSPRARCCSARESLDVEDGARRRGPDRLGADAARRRSSVDVDRELARFGAWYELFPRSWGGFAGVEQVLPRARRARLRRRLPAADPPDRPHEPQGPQQRARRPSRTTPAARGRSAAEEGGHTRSTPSSARSRTSTGSSPRARRARARDRARLRDPVLARPPVAEGASGVVPPPPRRDAQVRREPAQALPGHLQRQLRERGLARGSGRRCATSSCTGSTHGVSVFRVDNPHTKPLAVLGVADRGGARRSTRASSSSPRRSRGRR